MLCYDTEVSPQDSCSSPKKTTSKTQLFSHGFTDNNSPLRSYSTVRRSQSPYLTTTTNSTRSQSPYQTPAPHYSAPLACRPPLPHRHKPPLPPLRCSSLDRQPPPPHYSSPSNNSVVAANPPPSPVYSNSPGDSKTPTNECVSILSACPSVCSSGSSSSGYSSQGTLCRGKPPLPPGPGRESLPGEEEETPHTSLEHLVGRQSLPGGEEETPHTSLEHLPPPPQSLLVDRWTGGEGENYGYREQEERSRLASLLNNRLHERLSCSLGRRLEQKKTTPVKHGSTFSERSSRVTDRGSAASPPTRLLPPLYVRSQEGVCASTNRQGYKM